MHEIFKFGLITCHMSIVLFLCRNFFENFLFAILWSISNAVSKYLHVFMQVYLVHIW